MPVEWPVETIPVTDKDRDFAAEDWFPKHIFYP